MAGLPLETRGVGAPVVDVAGAADVSGRSAASVVLDDVVSSMDSTVAADDALEAVSMKSRSAVADPGREEHAAASPTMTSSAVQPSACLVFMLDTAGSAAGLSQPDAADPSDLARCNDITAEKASELGPRRPGIPGETAAPTPFRKRRS